LKLSIFEFYLMIYLVEEKRKEEIKEIKRKKKGRNKKKKEKKRKEKKRKITSKISIYDHF